MIKVENLTRTFGPKVAVNNVSFTVGRGEILGFLGPNGAGKSTTMRMITGFIPPTSGRVSVGDHDIIEDAIAAKRLVGYLPENAPSYTDMTVWQFLNFTAELRGFRGAARSDAVKRVVDTCFLNNVVHQSVDTLSKGYRHRLCFAQSIIHDPQVLIMDEPTDGLDPNQKHEVRNLIRRMGEKKAIIFSTHILEEVEAVCTRAIIIDRGTIVASGTPNELKARSENAGVLSVRVSGLPADQVRQKLEELGPVKRAALAGGDGAASSLLRVYPRSREQNGDLRAAVADLVARERWRVEELHAEEGRLDEVFRSITMPETTRAAAR
ncbi:MAG: ATP-binding cassette domain-containing protein [Verrucomicrobiales bacterium]|nr:ATP-binding cassette domain-containing protein [Verrucomicrobiales bacterium]